MITVQDVEKSYSSIRVLSNINLTIDNGSVYGLVGRSGAGKSTLLRCINGIERYQSGSITVDGIRVDTLRESALRNFRQGVGMIFQHFSLLNSKDVYDNIAFPLRCWHYNKKEIDTRVRELLDLVDLNDKIHERPRNLSGGQKQRVAIARALTMNPKLLLSDEATSALDPLTANVVLELLRRINKELGITIIVVAHQMSVIRKLCDRVAIMESGRVAEEGTVEDIFFRQSPAFKRLAGTFDEYLPQPGEKLIEVFVSEKRDQGSLIAQTAIDLNLPFAIRGSNMEKYQDTTLGTFLIGIDEQHFSTISEYLNQHDIAWKLAGATWEGAGI